MKFFKAFIRKIYGIVRNNLASEYQSYLSKLAFKFSGRPIVKKDYYQDERFPDSQKGGMILSADFELAWAQRFSKVSKTPYQYALEKARLERANVPLLIKLFEKYKVAITWATVGHLFLEKSKKQDYAWMKRMPHFDTKWIRFYKGDWFDNVPFSRWENAPEWYAPDLIRSILDSSIKHEFGTHTFSHINFSNKLCPPEVAADEMKASIDAMKRFDLQPVSICFPAGSWGNVPVLKKYGIKIYRRKIVGLNLAYPYYDEHGLLVTLSTDAFDRLHLSWNSEYYRYRFKTAIDKAIETGTIAHFVFHPSMDPWMINEVMDGFLAYAVKLQNEGLLWIGTMSGICNFINNK